MLEVRVHNNSAGRSCHPVGELDAASSDVFRATLAELAAQVGTGDRVVIDLTDVPFVDSAGLGALISGVRAVRERGGDILLAGAKPSVANLLRTTEIDQIVDVEVAQPAP